MVGILSAFLRESVARTARSARAGGDLMEKIFPLNLTAQAAAKVPGNPVTTRLEGGVGNCFPGLEYDHRNLDRRFFPGLVFQLGSATGAELLRVDTTDPDLSPDTFEGPPGDAPDAAVQ